MRTTNFRRKLVLGVGALLSGALLTLPTTGTAFASDHKPQGGCYDDAPSDGLDWLDGYEGDLETTYGESDGSLYPECDNGVKAGPDGQGDWRGATWPR
jgi:hypothetical protein